MSSTWQDRFKYFTMRANFQLALTRPMIEFLCAVADDVWWDRALYRDGGQCAPDNFIASSHALVKRGLIDRTPKKIVLKNRKIYEYRSGYLLTPAGKLVVQLLKATGLFIEQDLAITRKAACKVSGIR